METKKYFDIWMMCDVDEASDIEEIIKSIQKSLLNIPGTTKCGISVQTDTRKPELCDFCQEISNIVRIVTTPLYNQNTQSIGVSIGKQCRACLEEHCRATMRLDNYMDSQAREEDPEH